jgi:hypothetical protein
MINYRGSRTDINQFVRGSMIAEGRKIVSTVRSLYADSVYIGTALGYAKSEGVITDFEFAAAREYRMTLTSVEYFEGKEVK